MRQTRMPRIAFALLVAAAPAAAQLVAAGHQRFDQGVLGNLVEVGDHFGAALAVGDFNGDGRADLAVGLPDEDVGSVVDAGAVQVVYGTASGLNLDPDASPFPLSLHQDVSGVNDVAEEGDRFGAVLVAGDFNGDGFDELAVGVPDEDLEPSPGVSIPDAGVVHVFLSGPAGIVPAADFVWQQEHFNGLSPNDWGDAFGASLSVCDRQGDGFDDLQVGLPGEDYLFLADSGAVILMYGSAGGLDADLATYYGGGGTETGPAAGDRFGMALDCGALNTGGLPEIVIGVPFGRASGAPVGAGLVRVLSPGGGADEVAGFDPDGRFGSAVAIAGLQPAAGNRLLVGAPGFGWGGIEESGFVRQFDGPTSFEQGWRGLAETREPFDQLGTRLEVGDFNGDGWPDAVFGVPGENLLDGTPGPVLDAGAVHVLYGNRHGVATPASQVWTFDSPGLGFSSLDNDELGGAVAAGDFDGDGVDDLAIGAPGAEWGGAAGTGLVQVLYGTWTLIYADTFEHGGSWLPW